MVDPIDIANAEREQELVRDVKQELRYLRGSRWVAGFAALLLGALVVADAIGTIAMENVFEFAAIVAVVLAIFMSRNHRTRKLLEQVLDRLD